MIIYDGDAGFTSEIIPVKYPRDDTVSPTRFSDGELCREVHPGRSGVCNWGKMDVNSF